MRFLVNLLAMSFALSTAELLAQPLRIQGVGFSVASGVSDDGRVVVGYDATQAFRWTRDGGPQPLGDLPGGDFQSFGSDVSADGSILLGIGTVDVNGDSRLEGFRWTESGGLTAIGTLNGEYSNARGISADGRTIVGWSGPGEQAFRWTADSGMQALSGAGLERFNPRRVRAFGVSGDGTAVVGTAVLADESATEGFRWTADGGFQGLGSIAGGEFTDSSAYNVSSDGRVVVGSSWSPNGVEAVRWMNGAIQPLGDLPGGLFSAAARAASGDGSIIVGVGNTTQGFDAFIWDAANGMRRLEDALSDDYGVDLAGWNLYTASDISSDGRVIVGEGINPQGQQEAWIVAIPEPVGVSFIGAALLAAMGRGVRKRGHH